MSPLALALLVAAAALHAGWNLIVKRAQERQVFAWWSLVVGSLCFLPLLLVRPALPAAVWPYVAASVLAEGLYYFALTRAYRIGDFSLVYPLARGAAPAFLALWTTIFLGERPSLGGLAGLGLLVLGLAVVGSGALAAKGGTVSAGGISAALTVACLISIYSTIDGAAVRMADPTAYTVVIIGLTALVTAPPVLLRHSRAVVLGELRAQWPSIIAVGVLTLLTYILVMIAYALAPVGYAGAIREVSVIFAALVGWWWLDERFGGMRTLGSVVIFFGIVVIATLG